MSVVHFDFCQTIYVLLHCILLLHTYCLIFCHTITSLSFMNKLSLHAALNHHSKTLCCYLLEYYHFLTSHSPFPKLNFFFHYFFSFSYITLLLFLNSFFSSHFLSCQLSSFNFCCFLLQPNCIWQCAKQVRVLEASRCYGFWGL